MLCDTLQLFKQLHHRGFLPVTVIVLSTQTQAPHHVSSCSVHLVPGRDVQESITLPPPPCCAGPAGGSHALPMFFSMPKDPEV